MSDRALRSFNSFFGIFIRSWLVMLAWGGFVDQAGLKLHTLNYFASLLMMLMINAVGAEFRDARGYTQDGAPLNP